MYVCMYYVCMLVGSNLTIARSSAAFTSWFLNANTALSWVRLRGPVIQANGRLTFEDDLRSGGLLCFISMNASVRTELANSMVTLGEPGGD